MKPKSAFRLVRTGSRLFAIAIVSLLASQAAHSATLYWDLNQDTANVAVAVDGTWDGANLYWNTDATGTGGTPQAGTTNVDDLVFSSGSLFTAGTVTLAGFQAASSITFEDNISVALNAPLVQNNAGVTADNTTDTFTYSGTAVQNGQMVSFGGTTVPAGLIAGQLYYIISATATTYQVSNTAGGTAIHFTDNGTSVTNTVQAPLTIGGSGAKSGIFVLAGDNQNNSINAPIILNGAATFRNDGNGGFSISGGITGTGNLALVNNGVGVGMGINGLVNNAGTVTYSGTSNGRASISTGVGSNVTGITQNSNTSNLMISGTVYVNSGGTTITNNGLQALTFFRDNTDYDVFAGTGNLIFNNDSLYSVPHGIDLYGQKGQINVNNIGTVTNSGTGLGGVRIDANIKTNVTGLIQNSATSNLYLVSAISTPGNGAVTQAGNTFTGPTSINAGILYSGYAGALTTTASITFGGGTLMYGAVSATDLSAKFSPTGTSPYSIDTNNLSVTLGSNLAANDTKGLNKFGPGTLTLSTTNTYTGTTTIGGGTGTLERLAGGTLVVSGSLNSGTGTNLTFNGTGTFDYPGLMLALTLNAGDATLTSAPTFASLAVRSPGATGNFPASVLTNTTNAPLDTSGSNNPGIFFGGSSYARYDTTNHLFKAVVYGTDFNAPPAVAGLSFGISTTAATDISLSGNITAQTTAALDTLNLGANNLTLASGATLSVNGILVNNSGITTTFGGGTGITPTASGGELVIRTNGATDILTLSSPILANGTNVVTKSGAGTLSLSGANTYTGNTVINQGSLILDTPSNKTYGGVITGAGALVVTGPGTLTLTKQSPFTGGLTISHGTLKLDFSDAGAPTAEMLNGVNLLTLGSAGANNVVQGGGTLLIKAKDTGITTQNLSVALPGNPAGLGIITNAGSSRILVDPNGGTGTQVLMGMLQNVIMRSGNAERQPSNGSTLLIGKTAGALSGSLTFIYASDGRNGQGYSGNFPARMVYTPDGGTTVDFMRYGGDNTTSPYYIVPITDPASGTSYTTLATNQGGGGYVKLSGSDASVTGIQGGYSGLKIENPDAGRSITVATAGTFTPGAGIIMTGTNDFTISGGFMSSDNNANGRAYVFQQYSTGTLTVSSVLNNTNTGAHLLKSGPGRLVLAGANTYGGTTYFNEGTLTAGIAQNGTTSGPFGPNGTLYFAGGTLQYSADTGIAITDYSPRFSTSTGQPISIDTNGRDVSFATALNSAGSTLTLNDTAVTKGSLTLATGGTYTGPTTVNAGTLAIGGSATINSTSGVNIGAATFKYNNSTTSLSRPVTFTATGGTLGGTGTIATAVTVTSGNTLAPGASVGALRFTKGLTIADGGIFNWENNTVNTLGTAGTNWDVANVSSGTTTISNTPGTGAKLKLQFTNSDTSFLDGFWDAAQTWDFMIGGSVSGTNHFDTGNITIFINSVQQGTGNSITGQGAFSTAIADLTNNLQLLWTPAGGGGGPVQTLENSAPNNPVNARANSTLSLSGTLTNTGGSNLAVALTSTGTLTVDNLGADSSPVLNGVPASVTGTIHTGSSAGGPHYWGVTNTDALASPTSASINGAVFVYDLARAKYTGTTLAFGSVHQGASVTSQTVAIGNSTMTDASYQDLLDVSAATGNAKVTATGFTGLGASTNGATTNNLSFSVNTTTPGSLASTAALTLTSNANGVTGLSNGTADVVGGGTITTTGSVYSGQMVWSGTSGNWSTGGDWTDSVSGGGQAAPGTDSNFTGVDSAAFDAAGTHTVTVDQAANLNALSFNGLGTYLLAGSSSLTLAGTSPLITAAGSQSISAPLTLAQGVEVRVTDSGDSLEISGNINSGIYSYSLTKTGAGTLTLSGNNSYNGGTTVTGTLLVNNTTGSGTGSGAVNVNAGATLGGTGAISGAVNVSGILAPGGATLGSLASGPLTLNDGSTYRYKFNSTTVGADLQNITGGLSLSGTIALDLVDLASLSGQVANGTTFSLFNYSGTWNSGRFTYNLTNILDDGESFTDLYNNKWIIDYNASTKGSNVAAAQAGSYVNLSVESLDAYYTWAASKGLDNSLGKESDPAADPDHDGANNLAEFAFNGNPLDGKNKGQIFGLQADSSGDGKKELILTVAVRKNTGSFTSGAPATALVVDGITYSIEGSTTLGNFDAVVTQVAEVDPGTPVTDATNYKYASFRLEGSNNLPGKGFLRAKTLK